MVVGEPLVVERVVAEHHLVRSRAAGRFEVGELDVLVVVVALFRIADAAEGRRPVSPAARAVAQQRALDEVGEGRPAADEAEVTRGEAGLDEELRAQDPVVVQRVQIQRRLADVEAGGVHRAGGAEGVVQLFQRFLRVCALEAMVRTDRAGQLDLEPFPLIFGLVGQVDRLNRVARHLLVLKPAGGEKPQAIFPDRTAEHVLMRRDDRVDLRIVREAVRIGGRGAIRRRHGIARLPRLARGRRGVVAIAGHQRAPVVVEQRLAERAAEQVAAGLGDDVDETAAEPAVLRRHAVGRDRGFLNRVLDVDVERLPAQVLIHGDAVHQVQRLERHRAGDRIIAPGARRVNRRGHQQHGVDVAIGRQHRHQLLREVGRDLRCLRQDIGGLAHHVDRLVERGQAERDVERHRLRRGDGNRPLLIRETAQRECDGVGPGWQLRKDVVAVLRRHGGKRTLEIRALHGDRHAGDREVLIVDHASGNRA